MSDRDIHWHSDYKRQLEIGDFRVDPGALAVHGDGDPVRLKPKAMAVLLELARQPGITLTREELIERVWKSTYVTQGVLGHAITALRRAFGDTLDAPRYIETIPRIGYRLLAPVRVFDEVGDAATASAPHLLQPDADESAANAAPGNVPDADALAGGLDGVHALDTALTTGMHIVTDVSTTAVPETPRADAATPPARASATRAPRTFAHAPRRRALLLVTAGVALATVAVIGPAWWRSTASAPPPAAATATAHPTADTVVASTSRRLTFATGSETSPRLDATGERVVYTVVDRLGAPPRLMLQSTVGTSARTLADGTSADRPAWSPDSQRVAFVGSDDGHCAIRVARIDRPGAQTAARCTDGAAVYVDWSPVDAGLMAYTATGPGDSGGSAVQLLADGGGWRAQPLRYDRPADAVDLYPRYSPDGRWIAFRRGTNPTSDIYVMAATGGAVTRVTRVRARINGFDWLADGSGLVMSSSHEGTQQLYSVVLRSGAVTPLGILNASFPDIAARSERMTYQQDDRSTTLSEVGIAPDATSIALSPSSGRDSDAAISANGARVVFASDRDGTPQLWSLDVRSGRTERLTRHAGMNVSKPVLSSDGQRVLYVTGARGRHELWEVDLRSRQRVRLVSSSTSINNAVYAADDHAVWFTRWQGTQWSLFGCTRSARMPACVGRETAIAARRVERGRDGAQDVLVLSTPQSPDTLEIVSERGLVPLRRIAQPLGDSWETIDGAVWSLATAETEGRDVTMLTRTALDGDAPRVIATWRGLHPQKYAGFAVAPDRRRVILPVVSRDSTDLAYTVLERRSPASATASPRRVERAAP